MSLDKTMVPKRGLAEVIDEIQHNQQARGYYGRSAEEIDAGLREGEDEYERRMQSLGSESHSEPMTGKELTRSWQVSN